MLFSTQFAVILIAILAVFGFIAFRCYQVQRTRRIQGWIHEYLLDRFGRLPNELIIHCTEDELWPVFVEFISADGLTRHRLQFTCSGPRARFALLSEIEDRLGHAPA